MWIVFDKSGFFKAILHQPTQETTLRADAMEVDDALAATLKTTSQLVNGAWVTPVAPARKTAKGKSFMDGGVRPTRTKPKKIEVGG
jgi:hypothetical protein